MFRVDRADGNWEFTRREDGSVMVRKSHGAQVVASTVFDGDEWEDIEDAMYKEARAIGALPSPLTPAELAAVETLQREHEEAVAALNAAADAEEARGDLERPLPGDDGDHIEETHAPEQMPRSLDATAIVAPPKKKKSK